MRASLLRSCSILALALSLTALAAAGCSAPVAPADDAGAGDAARADASDGSATDARTDTGLPPTDASGMDAAGDDAQIADAATDDAATDDAASVDATATDAFVPMDAFASDAGNDAGSDAGASADAGADASTPSDAGPAPAVQLSEILADPPGADANNELVELRCTAGLALDGLALVIVDGDFATGTDTRGVVTFSKALTGLTCGANGIVLLQRGTVYDGVAGTTYGNRFFTDNIQNGSQTYLLVLAAQRPAVGADLDGTANDGVIADLALAAAVVDGVAILDGDATDRAYSPAVVVFAADAATRFSTGTAVDGASWYCGAVIGPSPFHYDPTSVSSNFPATGALSPGEPNTP